MNEQTEQLNELALFAGAGGGILGGHLLGWRCVCAVEWKHALVQNLYLWAKACEQRTDEILSYLPADWRIDVATFTPLVHQRLFTEEWLRTVGLHFHELLKHC